MGGPGSGVSQDAELAALESLVSDLKKELLEQHEEAEAARADAVAARQDAQECHANMAALEEHVRIAACLQSGPPGEDVTILYCSVRDSCLGWRCADTSKARLYVT